MPAAADQGTVMLAAAVLAPDAPSVPAAATALPSRCLVIRAVPPALALDTAAPSVVPEPPFGAAGVMAMPWHPSALPAVGVLARATHLRLAMRSLGQVRELVRPAPGRLARLIASVPGAVRVMRFTKASPAPLIAAAAGAVMRSASRLGAETLFAWDSG